MRELKLNGWIRSGGVRFAKGQIGTIEHFGISQSDADVLVRRGTAEWVDAPVVAAPVASAPEVTNLELGKVDADTVEGGESIDTIDPENLPADAELVGVADADGNVTELADMKYSDLVALANDLGIKDANKTKKADLVEAIKAAQQPATE